MGRETAPAASALDARALQDALASCDPSMRPLVSAQTHDGAAHLGEGGTFSVVSLDPPLALVTLSRGSAVARALSEQPFAVEVPSSAASAAGSAATVWCSPWNVYDGGDHIIAVGEVTAYELGSAGVRQPQY